jgi:(p)ppGpp synthase/HD superfamily hydrolase
MKKLIILLFLCLLRVMLQLESIDERIAGVLHDVLEDTRVTMETLRPEGFSETVLTALESVTGSRKLQGYSAWKDNQGQSYRLMF